MFRKQKQFLRSFSGTVKIDDTIVQVKDGDVVSHQRGGLTADIVSEAGRVTFNKHGWANNPTLVREFISYCMRKVK